MREAMAFIKENYPDIMDNQELVQMVMDAYLTGKVNGVNSVDQRSR